jgi:hypothetical protein
VKRYTKLLTAFLLAAAVLPPAGLWAARPASSSFLDAGGVPGFGSANMVSASYYQNGNVQEVAVSTQQSSAFSQRTGKLAFFPQPATVPDLTVVLISSYAVKLVWSAPSSDITRDSPAADGYILRYTSAAFISDEAAFARAARYSQAWIPLAPGTAETKVLEGFDPGTTYYFSVESVNSYQLRSEVSNPAAAFALTPLSPMNFKLARSGNAITMSWVPPAGFSNRIAFNDRFKPAYPYEVKSYQVFRATSPADAQWDMLAEVSSTTLAWTDVVGSGDEYYYSARAVNMAGPSAPSYARDSLSGSLYFLAPDNRSVLEIPKEGAGAFFTDSGDPLKAYSVEVSTHPEDLGGRVMKSVEFRAYRGGLLADDNFRLSSNGTVKLFYGKSGGAVVPTASDAKTLTMFYYNGSRWMQMYGRVDDTERSVSLVTTLLGRYQLRTTDRSGGFSADKSGLTNRLITPNGDGKNDTMVFIFDNPQDKAVTGTIFDLRGAKVAAMKPGPVGNSLIWDAKAGGQVVPGGVYIYQIESQGTVYNGTVAVIR